MKISILTLFPEMFEGFLNTSIIKRAIGKQQVFVELINIRDYTTNKYNRVDAPPIGGGAGLVMLLQPLVDALKSIEPGYKVLLTPRGKTFNQRKAISFTTLDHLILICGHYEGVDERIYNYIDDQISIGDFVLTGGELAAMAISDAIIRLLPEVISPDSLCEESFSLHNLLEYPQYTEPRVYEGHEVPEILYSGNHKVIKTWRKKQSIYLTYLHRRDLFDKYHLHVSEEKLLEDAINNVESKEEKLAIEKAKKSKQGKKASS